MGMSRRTILNRIEDYGLTGWLRRGVLIGLGASLIIEAGIIHKSLYHPELSTVDYIYELSKKIPVRIVGSYQYDGLVGALNETTGMLIKATDKNASLSQENSDLRREFYWLKAKVDTLKTRINGSYEFLDNDNNSDDEHEAPNDEVEVMDDRA
jgi:hypothetical protein